VSFQTEVIDGTIGKPQRYELLRMQLIAVTDNEPNFIANGANAAALLFQSLPDINWAGFYLLEGADLVLGPFQGKPACTRIPLGKGVCGTAANRQETIVVPDVHLFPGHIACDSASRSEIVVPLLRNGELLGVLDLDSPVLNRFDAEDSAGLQAFVEVLLTASTEKAVSRQIVNGQ